MAPDPGSVDAEADHGAGSHRSIEPFLETAVVPADARSRRSVGLDARSGRSTGTKPSRDELAGVTEASPTATERARPIARSSEPEPGFATRSDAAAQVERGLDPSRTVVAVVRPLDPRPALALPVTDRWTGPHEPPALRGGGPIIRVSIGRIEVRAITAPWPLARVRTAPPSAAPSLDDYLRARNRTGR
jgi:hypothetical protein